MKNAVKSLMAVMVVLMMAAPANAQFGSLKGLAKSAKTKVTNTAKEKAKDKVNDAKSTATSKASQTISNMAGDRVADVLGETVHADQLTGNETDGQAEQNLNTLFPYDREQFAPCGVYLDGTEKVENYILYLYIQLVDILNKNEGYAHGARTTGSILNAPGGTVLAYGEPIVNAFFYDYMKKPNDYKNYRQMIKAYVIAQAYYFGFLKQKMVDGSDNMMINEKGEQVTLWEKENDRLFRGYMLMKAAEELAAKSDYNNIFDGTYSILTQADGAYDKGNMTAAYNNYREFRIAYENFLTHHPQWSSDSRAGSFTAMYEKTKKRCFEIRDAIIDDQKVPQDMPPTFAAIPGLEKIIRSRIAIEDPDHQSAPIVFLSSGWRPLYKSGSHIIDQRAVDVGWTYTDDKGQKWLAFGTFMQKAVYEGLVVKYIDQYMFSGGYKTMKLK